MKLSQRFGSNLTTLFSYTWSKSLDDGSAIRGVANDFAPQDMRCRACEYGLSSFNVPHRFVTSILYNLPFGKGQKFLNHGGIVNQVVGGWQVSTITTLQSGSADRHHVVGLGRAPLSIPNSNRINCSGLRVRFCRNPTANAYFNPAAFSNTVAGQYGTCARNNLKGPRQVNIDFSTIKDFRIAEAPGAAVPHGNVQCAEPCGVGQPERVLGQFECRGAQPASARSAGLRQACARFSSP